MAETHWIIVEKATGNILWSDYITGGAHPKDKGFAWDSAKMEAHRTNRSPDEAVDSIDPATWTWKPDPQKVAGLLHARIDAGARARLVELRPPEMERIYRRKEAEAKALLAGEAGPFLLLAAEAEATGIAPAKLAEEVIAAADAAAAMDVKIEAARRGAKAGVLKGRSIKAMREAANVDWEGIM